MSRAEIYTDQLAGSSLQAQHTVDRTKEDTETEIDLMELLFQFLAHIRLILMITLLGALGAAAYTQFWVTPIYEATAKLYVLNSSDSALNLSDLQIGSYLASDYIEVFKTWEVHEMVITNLGLPYSYTQLQSMLTIENPTDTRILYITIHSPGAKEAADIANEYAKVALKYIANTMATEEPNIMSVALEPTNPASPSKSTNILLGGAVGFILALAWITLRFVMDDKIKTVDDIRKYANLPVLAVVPIMATMLKKNDKEERRKTAV